MLLRINVWPVPVSRWENNKMMMMLLKWMTCTHTIQPSSHPVSHGPNQPGELGPETIGNTLSHSHSLRHEACPRRIKTFPYTVPERRRNTFAWEEAGKKKCVYDGFPFESFMMMAEWRKLSICFLATQSARDNGFGNCSCACGVLVWAILFDRVKSIKFVCVVFFQRTQTNQPEHSYLKNCHQRPEKGVEIFPITANSLIGHILVAKLAAKQVHAQNAVRRMDVDPQLDWVERGERKWGEEEVETK